MLAEADLKRLLASADGKDYEKRRDTAMLRLFIDTGMRCSELANLGVEDLDPDPGVAIVVGKGRRPRACPFGNKTAAALDRYLRLRSRHPRATDPDLWLGQRGKMTDSGVRQMVECRAAQAGLGRVHPHMLRHGFAHDWLRKAATRATSCACPGGDPARCSSAMGPQPRTSAPERRTAAWRRETGCETRLGGRWPGVAPAGGHPAEATTRSGRVKWLRDLDANL